MEVLDSSLMPKRAPRDPVARALGNRLRQVREAAELTQEELGRRSKLSPKFISQVENGHVNPSIGVVTRLAGGVGLPLPAFFSTEAPETLVDDLSAIAALVSAQAGPARQRALRVLRALFDE